MDIIFIIIGLTCIFLAGFLSHYIRKCNKLNTELEYEKKLQKFIEIREKDCEFSYGNFFRDINCQIVNSKINFIINDKDRKDVIRIPLNKIENYSFEIFNKVKE